MKLEEAEKEIQQMAQERAKEFELDWEKITEKKLQIGTIENSRKVVVTIHTEIHNDPSRSYKFQGKLANEIEGKFSDVKVFEFGDWFQLIISV